MIKLIFRETSQSSCVVFGDSEEVSTDGDAADAGGLHARHVESRWGWRLTAGAWQGRRRGALALGLTRDSGSLAERLTRSAARTNDRAHLSPSDAGLNEAAGGGRARAHQVLGYDREAGPAPAHKSNFAHSHAFRPLPPLYSIFRAGHIS
ncbi:unnamed protein product [Leptosia nina]|uniref:Uncharacterized protein n=1 Tax=Leptosia nina TaxID=320188 RepID=A0AAV1JND8_9NEOP